MTELLSDIYNYIDGKATDGTQRRLLFIDAGNE